MRILLVSDDPDDPSVGASKVQRKLKNACEELGHTCHLLFRENLGSWPRSPRWRGAVAPWLAETAVRRAWQERGPYDVLDIAGAEAWRVARAAQRGGFAEAAVIARSHGLEALAYAEMLADARAGLSRKPWWRRIWHPLMRLRLEKRAFHLADGVLVLNQRERAWVLERAGRRTDQVAVIAHGVSRQFLDTAPPAPAPPRGRGALFVGPWYAAKGHRYLAQAHALLCARGTPLPLTVLGAELDAPLHQVEPRVRADFAPASQPWLRFLPRTRSEAGVFAAYQAHDFLVMASTVEAFGLAALEAMSQRLPLICTTAAGIAERLTSENEALLVPARDPEALAAAMERMWREPDLRHRIAERGHAWASEFTWRRAAEATLHFYAGIARRSPAARGSRK